MAHWHRPLTPPKQSRLAAVLVTSHSLCQLALRSSILCPIFVTDVLQRGRVVCGVVFTTAMIARLMVKHPSKLRCSSFDKMLHDNYSYSVESKKQRIKEVRSKTSPEISEPKATRPTPISECGFVV